MHGRILRSLSGACLLLFVSAVARAASPAPLSVVPHVDLQRYEGRWYEIARLPNFFQKQCVGDVTADYSLTPDGKVGVVNSCRLKDGERESVDGVARRARPDGPAAKLEVSFVPRALRWLPFTWGDYWIIALGPDYSWSLVGTPDREYLWVLSRSPTMDDATYDAILATAARQGFDTTAVSRTRQTVRADRTGSGPPP
ncbi:MAG: lipocalin [Betaproteobacteria bacterium]|nr:lipocalin [Betaproteobacteria bacterium]